MKVIKKVKCNLCGDVITLKNDQQWVKCKNGCTEIYMNYKGWMYAKPDYDCKNCETVETYKLCEEEDYLIPNEELLLLIEKLKKLSKESNDDYRKITIYDYINRDTDDEGNSFLNHIEFKFDMIENTYSHEYNTFSLNLYFKKEDLYESDTIESYIKRVKNFIKIYNYFNDKNIKYEKPMERKDFEKEFYDDFMEWDYEQKKHYDVDYYI